VKRDLSWLKDWRAAGTVGAIAGFVAGLLLFYEPWHLRPAYGDLATWLLVVLAAVAAWVGLSQLHAIQEQIGEETKRNVNRDKLLDKQLAEADARALTERRRQAEDVKVSRPGDDFGVVENKSRRPVSDITCRVMSKVDKQVLKLAGESGSLIPAPVGSGWQAVDAKHYSRVEMLRPEAACGFWFDGLTEEKDQLFVAWFTDDAGFRWQLDEYQHLVQAGSDDEYKW
jgi:hypothetical protein